MILVPVSTDAGTALVLLLSFFLSFFVSPGHDLFTVSKQLAIRFQQNFTRILMGSVRIAVQNYIDLAVDLDLSRSQICKSTFWAISQNLTQDSLDQGLSISEKIFWAVWTCDVRERITLSTIMQKEVFDHNFWTKHNMECHNFTKKSLTITFNSKS